MLLPLVAVASAALTFAMAQTGGPGPSSPAAPTSGSLAAIGEELHGVPRVDVARAVTVRDAGDDNGELAVHGFYSAAPPIPCPFLARGPSPIRPVCPEQFAWIAQEPEKLVEVTANSMNGRQPSSLALHPTIHVDADWRLNDAGADRVDAQPVELIVVGHFDDHRAAFCPADERQRCADQFVIDRLLAQAGVPLRPAPWADLGIPDPKGRQIELSTTKDAAVVSRAVRAARPGGVIVSIGAVAATNLAGIEPLAAFGDLGQPKIVWVVRDLEPVAGRMIAVTLLVPDDQDTVFEVEPDRVRQIHGPPATQAVGGSLRVLLGEGDAPPQVIEINDLSGLLVAARPADARDQQPRLLDPEPTDVSVGSDLADDRVLRVTWTASSCDPDGRLTIDPSGLHALLEFPPGQECEVAVDRDIVLTFRQTMNAIEGWAIQHRELIPAPQPAATDQPSSTP